MAQPFRHLLGTDQRQYRRKRRTDTLNGGYVLDRTGHKNPACLFLYREKTAKGAWLRRTYVFSILFVFCFPFPSFCPFFALSLFPALLLPLFPLFRFFPCSSFFPLFCFPFPSFRSFFSALPTFPALLFAYIRLFYRCSKNGRKMPDKEQRRFFECVYRLHI